MVLSTLMMYAKLC